MKLLGNVEKQKT